MPIRKNTLLTVPLYCTAASLITFFLVVYGVGRFALITQPDGTVTSDEGKTLLIYGFILAASLLIGGPLLFTKMTKKEIALSAAIWAAFHLVLVLIGYAAPLSGSTGVLYMYLSMTNDWCSFIPLLLMVFLPNILLCDLVGLLSPFLFVLFGKRALKTER